jgi:hypothetical protein
VIAENVLDLGERELYLAQEVGHWHEECEFGGRQHLFLELKLVRWHDEERGFGGKREVYPQQEPARWNTE